MQEALKRPCPRDTNLAQIATGDSEIEKKSILSRGLQSCGDPQVGSLSYQTQHQLHSELQKFQQPPLAYLLVQYKNLNSKQNLQEQTKQTPQQPIMPEKV